MNIFKTIKNIFLNNFYKVEIKYASDGHMGELFNKPETLFFYSQQEAQAKIDSELALQKRVKTNVHEYIILSKKGKELFNTTTF